MEDQRDLNTFLEDQDRYEAEKRMKKEKLLLTEAEEEAKKKNGPKMNAMSRRIMERKQQRDTENENNENPTTESSWQQPTRHTEKTPAASRLTTKVPTGSI